MSMSRLKVLVTGATGFVGRALIGRLQQSPGFEVYAVVRRSTTQLRKDVQACEVGDFNERTDFHEVLAGTDIVVHAAARAHVLHDNVSNPLAEYRRINVDVTRNLARQAIESNVKRFVYVSSVGVNGSESVGAPFTEASPPSPTADYAVSKYEAEQVLQSEFQGKSTELVIIRPPLVYGADAPGNIGRLLRLIASGLPLPLGSVRNKRSLLARENLVDFIVTCIQHPDAAGHVFLVADGEDVSTVDLLRLLAEGMGKRLRLLPVPMSVIKFGATLLGRHYIYQQLCGNLQVDISKARTLLNWSPPVSASDALRKTGADFLAKAEMPQ